MIYMHWSWGKNGSILTSWPIANKRACEFSHLFKALMRFDKKGTGTKWIDYIRHGHCKITDNGKKPAYAMITGPNGRPVDITRCIC